MSKSLITETIKKKCEKCGNEFDATVFKVMGRTLPTVKVCSDCGEKERLEKERYEKEYQENQLKKQRHGWLVNSGIPPRFQPESFETFKISSSNKKVVGICKDYADNFPLGYQLNYKSLGLFSSGTWGIGKSHLACSIGHGIIDRWEWRSEKSPIYYVTEPNLFTRIRATYNRYSDGMYHEYEQDVYKYLTNVPLLIIDDVGKEEVSDPRFVQRAWYSIVNGRYDNLKPIVITANLTPDEIATHLGGSRNNEASFDRLYEMLGGVFYEMTGKSYRRKQC